MTNANKNNNPENRVLVFMPTGRDATLVCRTLEEAEISAEPCADADDLEEKLKSGTGAVLLAEEALEDGTLERLVETFDRQPVWSDIPVILFAGNPQNSERLLNLVGTRFNATIVERPIRIAMLVSAVRGALRARERQYQARDLLNQLEQADHQKDLFLATLSHELRTPLNSMLGWIKLLRDNSDNAVDLEHGLDVIERNTRAQSKVISDILFVSRVITGKLELELEKIDLLPIIRTAIDIVQPAVEAKNIELDLSFDCGDCQVMGEADRLQQVFLNLLSNAIKFTPDGGRIDVRVKDTDSTVEIKITDSGQGIKPEFLPFVFERFRQADSSYTREAGGLGLGLAIVKHLVEQHGGEVSVESDGESRGSTFTVTLPVLEISQSALLPSASCESAGKPSEQSLEDVHILLVEDDADSREMLEVFFNQFDMKVTAVESAAKALQAVKEFQPDILVSDVGLPGEDGYKLMRRIRELAPEKGGQIPALALTGYASLQDRSLAIEAGYQEHLAKPVDLDKLVELVKDLLVNNSNSN